ncbi:DNA polymerase III subunit gamma/tau, partial [[Clostridium] scindens]|nr:DNA polymerase III subunit gamma/tau [[Clostridium] scindens]
MEESTIVRYINVFSDTAASIKYSSQKRIVLEMAVIKLCRPQMEVDTTSLIERVRMLEKKLDDLE